LESLDRTYTFLSVVILGLALSGCANGGGPPSPLSSQNPDASRPPPGVDCGNLGNPCCEGRCEGVLMCLDGTCSQASCGAIGEPCCTGTPACFTGLSCAASGCVMGSPRGADAGTPGPIDSGASGTDSSMPPADSGAPPPPPATDPCSDAVDCLDCTSRETCGFCDGACLESDFLGPATCGSYAWFTFECAL
jgi:hypothetical protein